MSVMEKASIPMAVRRTANFFLPSGPNCPEPTVAARKMNGRNTEIAAFATSGRREQTFTLQISPKQILLYEIKKGITVETRIRVSVSIDPQPFVESPATSVQTAIRDRKRDQLASRTALRNC